MTYIRKEHRRLLSLCDHKLIIPKEFTRFRKEIEDTHNLIIKSKGNKCICTNCENVFSCLSKINSYSKCPKCKERLLIKTDRLTHYVFKDNLQLVDLIEDKFVVRTFELYTSYSNKVVKHYCTEYMRTLIIDNRDYDYVSNLISNHMGYMYVSHWRSHEFWRKRCLRWSYRDVRALCCPYNLKKLLRNTDLKYSQLWNFVKHAGYIDTVHYLEHIAHYPRFEYFVKLKLYNLADDVDKFNSISNKFEDVFGVSKDFYPFMVKHNINYDQLVVLKCSKTPNIRLLKALENCDDLWWFTWFVDIKTSWRKGLLNRKNIHDYKDYLTFCRKLGYDMKDKKILYPTNLKKEHDKLSELVEIYENEINERLMKERYELLKKNTYKSGKYIIYPALTPKDLIDESKQQSNCVKTYIEKASMGECDIYFLRLNSNIDKSLVTVEVRNNKVVQARIKHNNEPTKEQWKFLNKWEEKVLLKGSEVYASD